MNICCLFRNILSWSGVCQSAESSSESTQPPSAVGIHSKRGVVWRRINCFLKPGRRSNVDGGFSRDLPIQFHIIFKLHLQLILNRIGEIPGKTSIDFVKLPPPLFLLRYATHAWYIGYSYQLSLSLCHSNFQIYDYSLSSRKGLSSAWLSYNIYLQSEKDPRLPQTMLFQKFLWYGNASATSSGEIRTKYKHWFGGRGAPTSPYMLMAPWLRLC